MRISRHWQINAYTGYMYFRKFSKKSCQAIDYRYELWLQGAAWVCGWQVRVLLLAQRSVCLSVAGTDWVGPAVFTLALMNSPACLAALCVPSISCQCGLMESRGSTSQNKDHCATGGWVHAVGPAEYRHVQSHPELKSSLPPAEPLAEGNNSHIDILTSVVCSSFMTTIELGQYHISFSDTLRYQNCVRYSSRYLHCNVKFFFLNN